MLVGLSELISNVSNNCSHLNRSLISSSVLPTLSGTCDLDQFYVTVAYGSQGNSFQTLVGARDLTPELAALYQLQQNNTHFTIQVPYAAEDVVFEVSLTNYGLTLNMLQSLNFLSCSLLAQSQSEPDLTCCCGTPKTAGCSVTFTWLVTFP